MQAAIEQTGPVRRVAASACIRRSVNPRTWVYMLFRRSHGMSSLIAGGACAYVEGRENRSCRRTGSLRYEDCCRLQAVFFLSQTVEFVRTVLCSRVIFRRVP
jgi:hypothetical protein